MQLYLPVAISRQAVISSQEKHQEVLFIHKAAIFPLWQYWTSVKVLSMKRKTKILNNL